MLGRGYITIGSTRLPNPVNLSIEYDNIESQGVSEAGTLLTNVTRLLRRNITITCQVTSYWRDKIKILAGVDSTTLTIQGETLRGRLRLKSDNLEPNSEHVTFTDGLWTMKLTFIED